MLGVTILQPRTGKYDLRVAIVFAQRFEQYEVAAAVDVEVGPRVLHAAHRARLTGEVNHDLLATDDGGHPVEIAKVSFHYRDAGLLQRRHLLGVTAPIGRKDRGPGAAFDQFRGEVDADEAKAANHQHARVGEIHLGA